MESEVLPTSNRTPVTPEGTVQVNLASFKAYHLFGSGCVKEEILGAESVPEIMEEVVGEIVVGTAPARLNCASPKLAKILVPCPSLASTVPEEKLREAEPAVFTLKFIVSNFPLAPVNPGLSAMPSKLTMPALFESIRSEEHTSELQSQFHL